MAIFFVNGWTGDIEMEYLKKKNEAAASQIKDKSFENLFDIKFPF